MRLNNGGPVWHASVSLQNPEDGYKTWGAGAQQIVEAAAVELCRGVGRRDGEWWLFSEAGVGHLRVGLTDHEIEARWGSGGPPPATADAGDSGDYRARTLTRNLKPPLRWELAKVQTEEPL